jgi:hypothetical protein
MEWGFVARAGQMRTSIYISMRIRHMWREGWFDHTG